MSHNLHGIQLSGFTLPVATAETQKNLNNYLRFPDYFYSFHHDSMHTFFESDFLVWTDFFKLMEIYSRGVLLGGNICLPFLSFILRTQE